MGHAHDVTRGDRVCARYAYRTDSRQRQNQTSIARLIIATEAAAARSIWPSTGMRHPKMARCFCGMWCGKRTVNRQHIVCSGRVEKCQTHNRCCTQLTFIMLIKSSLSCVLTRGNCQYHGSKRNLGDAQHPCSSSSAL